LNEYTKTELPCLPRANKTQRQNSQRHPTLAVQKSRLWDINNQIKHRRHPRRTVSPKFCGAYGWTISSPEIVAPLVRENRNLPRSFSVKPENDMSSGTSKQGVAAAGSVPSFAASASLMRPLAGQSLFVARARS